MKILESISVFFGLCSLNSADFVSFLSDGRFSRIVIET